MKDTVPETHIAQCYFSSSLCMFALIEFRKLRKQITAGENFSVSVQTHISNVQGEHGWSDQFMLHEECFSINTLTIYYDEKDIII